MNVGHACCGFNLVLCHFSAVVTVGDVLPNRQIEKDWFLLNKAHQGSKPADVQHFDVVSIEENFALQWVVEALQEGDRRWFATTRWTD